MLLSPGIFLRVLSTRPFKIFVIEQGDDGRKFNRGKVLNIGFDLAVHPLPWLKGQGRDGRQPWGGKLRFWGGSLWAWQIGQNAKAIAQNLFFEHCERTSQAFEFLSIIPESPSSTVFLVYRFTRRRFRELMAFGPIALVSVPSFPIVCLREFRARTRLADITLPM